MARNRAYGFPVGNQIPSPVPIEESRDPTAADANKGILGQIWVNTLTGTSFIYGGSSSGWNQVSGGTRRLIESQTVTAAADMQFTQGIAAPTADYVLFFRNILSSTTPDDLRIQISTDGGSSYISTDYNGEIFIFFSGGTSQNSQTAFIPVTNTGGLSTVAQLSGQCYFYGITAGAPTNTFTATSAWNRGAGNGGGISGGTLPSFTTVNAIRLICTTGTLSGTATLYSVD